MKLPVMTWMITRNNLDEITMDEINRNDLDEITRNDLDEITRNDLGEITRINSEAVSGRRIWICKDSGSRTTIPLYIYTSPWCRASVYRASMMLARGNFSFYSLSFVSVFS